MAVVSLIFKIVTLFVSVRLINCYVCPYAGLANWLFYPSISDQDRKCHFLVSIREKEYDAIKNVCTSYHANFSFVDDYLENQIIRYLVDERLQESPKSKPPLALIDRELNMLYEYYDGHKMIRSVLVRSKDSPGSTQDNLLVPPETSIKWTIGQFSTVKKHFYNFPKDTKYGGQNPIGIGIDSEGKWRLVEPKDKFTCYTACEMSPVQCEISDECEFQNDGTEKCLKKMKQNKCGRFFPSNDFVCPCEGERYTTWSEWSECGGDCWNPTRYRTRNLTVDSTSVEPLMEVTTEGCLPYAKEFCCFFSPWSNWSSCSQTCDVGMQTRERKFGSNVSEWIDFCFQLINDSKSCSVGNPCNQDCVKEVGEWSSCTESCGKTGIRNRTVNILLKEIGDGIECPNKTTEEEACPDKPCPINCTMSDWIEQDCSVTCGTNGTRILSRTINQPELYDGECNYDKSLIERCHAEPCYENCTLGNDWEKWSECSVTCGSGIKVRQKILVKNKTEWGYCTTPESSEKCTTTEVCRKTTATEESTTQSSTLSNVAALSIIITISAVIILALVIATVYYVFKEEKKPASRSDVRMAVKNILRPDVELKDKEKGKKHVEKAPQPLKKTIPKKSSLKGSPSSSPNITRSLSSQESEKSPEKQKLHMYVTPNLKQSPSPTSKSPSPRSNKSPSPISKIPSPSSKIPSPSLKIPSPWSKISSPSSKVPLPSSKIPSPTSKSPKSWSDAHQSENIAPILPKMPVESKVAPGMPKISRQLKASSAKPNESVHRFLKSSVAKK